MNARCTTYGSIIAMCLLMTTINSIAQSFSSQSSGAFPTAAFNIRNVVADFDRDGDADILFQTGADGSTFNYAQSTGAGAFTIVAKAASPFAGVTLPNITPYGVYRTNDFDGDGDIDIWVPANSLTGTYLRNDGASFSLQPSTSFPAAAFNIRNVVADFDGDGDADILYQTGADNTSFSYAQNTGNATFSIVPQASSPFAALTLPNMNPFGLYRTADFDGDGDIDIWIPINGTTGNYYRNDAGTFTNQSSAAFPAASFNIRNIVADFDADGDADIMYQTGADNTAFSYARSNGNGTFTIVPQVSSPFAGLALPNASAFGLYRTADFDGDGDLDTWTPLNAGTGTYFMQNDAPPKVASFNPPHNATAVPRLSDITLNFSETVNKNVGNIYIVAASTNTIVETINVTGSQVTGSGTSYVINPATTLSPVATYNIRMDPELFTDVTGAVFAGLSGAQYVFTTGSALPLVWLNFQAAYVDDHVAVGWQTTGEVNTAQFVVERSTDGLSFTSVGQVAALNSSGEHAYAFNDLSVQRQAVYHYRVKQIDIDGRYTYSATVQARTHSEHVASLKVRQNPIGAQTTVAITLPAAANASLQLVNAAGVKVMERRAYLQAGETIMILQTGGLARGAYYLVLSAGKTKMRVGVVKE